GERPNLVRLNKDSVARVRFNPETKTLHVRDEDVVADYLAVRPDALRQLGEGAEVLFVERILDAEQMVLTDESIDEIDLFFAAERPVAVPIFPVAVELGRRQIQGRSHGESHVAFDAATDVGQEGESLLVLDLRDPGTLVPPAQRDVGHLLREGVSNEMMDPCEVRGPVDLMQGAVETRLIRHVATLQSRGNRVSKYPLGLIDASSRPGRRLVRPRAGTARRGRPPQGPTRSNLDLDGRIATA